MSNKRLMVILGNLTAFGPFVTDFYLPCLPELTRYFSATPSLVQVSLTSGMLGLAVGQIIIGPISDEYGRRKPLLWCLLLFFLSTMGCMLSRSIVPFIVFRLFQGITGASGLVISKAILSDTFTAHDLARYFAILAAVQGIAPIMAPVIGGVSFSLSSWQGTFFVLGMWSLWLLYACWKLRESLNKESRLRVPMYKSFLFYLPILRNGRYIVMNLILGFTTAALMSYISASPFIFQNHFGLTALQYSFCFAFNAVGLVIGSVVIMKVSDLTVGAKISTIGMFVTCVLASLALLFGLPFFVFEMSLFLILFCVGLVTPVTITLALNSVSENRGMASALIGAVPYLLGGIVAPLTGIGNMLHSMTFFLTLSSAICLTLYLVSRRWRYVS